MLREDALVTSDIYDQEGNLLFLRGTRLRRKIIDYLKKIGVEKVFLLTHGEAQEITAPIETHQKISEDLSDKLREHLKLHNEPGLIPKGLHTELRTSLQELFQDFRCKTRPDFTRLRFVASAIVELIQSTKCSLKLNDLIFYEPSLIAHSANVALISACAGKKLGLSYRQLLSLTMGALLHDVGLLELGIDGLKDLRKSFAESINPIPMSTHPEKGVKLLKNYGLTDEVALDIVYNHHERYDGLGYPRKLRGTEIPITSVITAIANDFVTLSSISEEGGLAPGASVMPRLIREGGRAYDPEVLRAFVQSVGAYPVGSLLTLSTGEIVMTVSNSSNNPLTPRTMVIRNANGDYAHHPIYIDLDEVPGVFVASVLRPDNQRVTSTAN